MFVLGAMSASGEGVKKKDPIERHKGRLLNEKLAAEAELQAIDDEVQKEVLEAVEWGKGSPYPDVKEVSEHVYA